MLRLADERPDGRQHIIRALVFRIATFQLLGVWDAEMEARHAPAVTAALS